MNNIGLIIAAGKQSRFNSEIPKALELINGYPVTSWNILALKPFCSDIKVVVSSSNEKFFRAIYPDELVLNIGESGRGSGDAIYRALKLLQLPENTNVIICWGDTLLEKRVVESTVNKFNNKYVCIPVVKEDQPYVQLKGGKVFFSKYGDKITKGYHDLSLFMGLAERIYVSCISFRALTLNAKGEYVHKHGNEFEFLDIFNDTGLKYSLNILDKGTYSFNTVEELEDIRSKLEVK